MRSACSSSFVLCQREKPWNLDQQSTYWQIVSWVSSRSLPILLLVSMPFKRNRFHESVFSVLSLVSKTRIEITKTYIRKVDNEVFLQPIIPILVRETVITKHQIQIIDNKSSLKVKKNLVKFSWVKGTKNFFFEIEMKKICWSERRVPIGFFKG